MAFSILWAEFLKKRLLNMPKLAPIKRKDLIYYLRQFGFDGPYAGGKHQIMEKDTLTITIPNPHKGDIGKDFLVRILKQARIDRKIWEDL
ncbi:MAG: type II toxin-antitoxin system HicA family toxin [Pyrinomonadaceae bacterium]